MKKFLKTTLLLLIAAMFFAGCQKEAEPEPTPEPDKIVLTDGIWHMDSTTSQTMTMNSKETTLESKQHIEMEITGDDVEILKATITYNGMEHDATEELKEAIKTKADAENADNLETEQPGAVSTLTTTPPNVTAETSFEKNEDGTEYKITSHISYVYADFVDEDAAAMMEYLGYDINAPVTLDSVCIYKRISD